MSITRVLLVAVLVAAVVPAMAVTVENYSWLQLSPQYTGSFVGSGNTVWTDGAGYGGVNDLRSRGFVWIPAPGMTGAIPGVNNSTGAMYWAALQLDQPRTLEKIEVQLWAQNGQATVTKFYIDASLDGSSWTQVGSYDYGSAKNFEVSDVVPFSITPNVYQYVRVRFESGDYQALITSYGGPGVLMINPIGSGELADEKVNWANRAFGTTIKASMYGSDYGVVGLIVSDAGVNHLIDGDLAEYNDDNHRAGVNTGLSMGQANAAMWFELDLKEPRMIDEVVGLWQGRNYGEGFTVQYSTDGTNFFDVKNPLRTAVSTAMTDYTFDPVQAQYWRITKLTGNQWCLLEQIMMYGPAVPEPMTLTLLAVGGLTLLRRRRK